LEEGAKSSKTKKLPIAESGLAQGAKVVQDRSQMAKTEREPSCEDCFFHKHRLCALNLGKPCTTFRPAERNLEPERQLAFVFRTERVTAAYAFPQPGV
jgi:hypothetical protein